MNLNKKYNDIPLLAKWKAIILDYGIDLASDGMFNRYEEIENYKTKYRVKKPTVKNYEFYDDSTVKDLIPSEVVLKYGNKRSLVKLGYRKSSQLELRIIEKQLQK